MQSKIAHINSQVFQIHKKYVHVIPGDGCDKLSQSGIHRRQLSAVDDLIQTLKHDKQSSDAFPRLKTPRFMSRLHSSLADALETPKLGHGLLSDNSIVSKPVFSTFDDSLSDLGKKISFGKHNAGYTIKKHDDLKSPLTVDFDDGKEEEIRELGERLDRARHSFDDIIGKHSHRMGSLPFDDSFQENKRGEGVLERGIRGSREVKSLLPPLKNLKKEDVSSKAKAESFLPKLTGIESDGGSKNHAWKKLLAQLKAEVKKDR
eukprot:TRINITY_DN141_c0_g1_i5.p1 TRINITY_DN141_c0_g1~~TRINITY_DN141_c0_g1_i5.p1  ORF type:complete len:261 (-),score=40.05 TRINITY_DN141_c0_g1_i5:93-875(-)